MPVPNDVNSKIGRAKRHLDEFEYLAKIFLNSDSYSLRCELNADRSKKSIYGKLTRSVPSELGLVIGDFANNARAALDYIVSDLTSLKPGDKGWTSIGFPILETRERWDAKHAGYLRGVDPKWFPIFESLQTHKTPAFGDALIHLHEINNRNKHHAVEVVAARARLGTTTVFGHPKTGVAVIGSNVFEGAPAFAAPPTGFNFGNGIRFELVGNGVLDEQETKLLEILRFPNDYFRVDIEVPLHIQFAAGQPGIAGRETLPTLFLILDAVEQVVRKFQ